MNSAYIGQLAVVVSVYWTVSILLVFVNKYLVEDPGLATVDISMFICWVQCIINVLLLLCIKTARSCITGRDRTLTCSRRLRTMRRIAVVSVTYVAMLYLNNLCLKSVGVSFYNTARSMTLVFTALFSRLLLRSPVSTGPLLCCLLVCLGFLLGIDQENDLGSLPLEGLLYGLLTSLVGSLNIIYIKKTLEVVSYDMTRFTLYNNVNAAVLCLPLIMTGELADLSLSTRLTDPHFWTVLCASGCLSATIAWVTAKQIDLTSPLTHNVSANSKAVLQSLVAVLYLGEHKPALWWLSIALVAAGSTAYAVLRIRQERRNTAVTPRKRVSVHRQRSRQESESHYS